MLPWRLHFRFICARLSYVLHVAMEHYLCWHAHNLNICLLPIILTRCAYLGLLVSSILCRCFSCVIYFCFYITGIRLFSGFLVHLFLWLSIVSPVLMPCSLPKLVNTLTAIPWELFAIIIISFVMIQGIWITVTALNKLDSERRSTIAAGDNIDL